MRNLRPRAVIRTLWCAFCGAELLFTQPEIDRIRIVPPCPRCREASWNDEVGFPVVWPGV